MKRRREQTSKDVLADVPQNTADGLGLLIKDSLDNDPGFADVWAPLALLSKLIDERIRLGLSQAEVATRTYRMTSDLGYPPNLEKRRETNAH